MDVISALGLSSASGLNAYIPLLILGLLDRYTSAVDLPSTWSWLSSPWALGIITVLLIVEIAADKIPAFDSVNDIIHTVIRPVSGGITFSSATAGEIAAAASNASHTASSGGFPWASFIVGCVVALVFHGAKSTARPVANVSTAGFAAPALSTAEDIVAFLLSLAAVLIPVLALILALLLVAFFAWVLFSLRRIRSRVDSSMHRRTPPA